MKSLEELRALREKMKSQTDNRSVAGEGETVIKVGMASPRARAPCSTPCSTRRISGSSTT